MRDKSNFDEGFDVLMQHKILIAVTSIVFLVMEGVNLLAVMLVKGNMSIVATIIISLLETPMFFGAAKICISACRNAQTSLGQLVEFYKPQLLFKSLLYGVVAMILYTVGVGGIAFICLTFGAAFQGIFIGFIAFIACFILMMMYMIKITPMFFIFVEHPETGVGQALSDGWVLTQGRMKDLLLVGWGIIWRSFLFSIIPMVVMLLFVQSHLPIIALIIGVLFSVVIYAYFLAVIGSVWLELNE